MVNQKKLTAIGLLVPILAPMIYLFFVALVSGSVTLENRHLGKSLRIFWILLAGSYTISVLSIGSVIGFLLRRRKGLALLPALSVGIAVLVSSIAATIWPVVFGDGGLMLSAVFAGINSILIVCTNGLIQHKVQSMR